MTDHSEDCIDSKSPFQDLFNKANALSNPYARVNDEPWGLLLIDERIKLYEQALQQLDIAVFMPVSTRQKFTIRPTGRLSPVRCPVLEYACR